MRRGVNALVVLVGRDACSCLGVDPDAHTFRVKGGRVVVDGVDLGPVPDGTFESVATGVFDMCYEYVKAHAKGGRA